MKRDFLITLNLPSWARWYAVDADGEVCVYRYKPQMHAPEQGGGLWHGWNNVRGESARILFIADMTDIDWTQTLHEIERAE